jgi:prepilin-type N-terminal cleavage/methylation domain-containing protein
MKTTQESQFRTPHFAFTLVEMLVVITIIGVLAGLLIPAVMGAVRRAKETAIAVEINQLDMALKSYKEKCGDYPPDFSSGTATIMRHLTTAFPRYVPGVSTPADPSDDNTWLGFVNDVSNGWGVNLNVLNIPNVPQPASALTFWLGGQPQWFRRTDGTPILPGNTDFDPEKPMQGFLGFSANPLNPFDNGSGRIKPFFDFDTTRLAFVVNGTAMGGTSLYWPKYAVGNKTNGAIVYFRAENENYYSALPSFINPTPKYFTDFNGRVVYPAMDVRASKVISPTQQQYTWINPQSFQIFSSGMDVLYSTPINPNDGFYPNPLTMGTSPLGPYEYPTGINYGVNTFDDITNFANGTLQSAIP